MRSHSRIPALRACAIAAALLLAQVVSAAPPMSRSLDAGWQFRLAPGDPHAGAHPQATAWLQATVPGSAQTDLLASKFVPDPFLGDNEAKIQWVGLSDWDYRTRFDMDAATLQRDHVELVFDGLDTFADVSLNGHAILSADNMFRRWRVPVKALLRAGGNTLDVRLHSPIARLQPWLAKQPYALPGEFDSAFGDEPKGRQTANYVRKAAYQYGWDWGPRIVTEGIWQPVRLEAWDDLRIADFHIAQTRVDADAAQLQAQLQIESDAAGTAHVSLRWHATHGATQALDSDVVLHAGENDVRIPVRIEHPQRWWPAGYGAQPMYGFDAQVSEGGAVIADVHRDTGLRSVELRRQRDRWGTSFEFVVNGVPVFAKGANFIPPDSFPTRVAPERFRQLLQSARDANMNMLRVWGGGYYLPDDFYAMADRMGIMVWQDFMFGGAIPPWNRAFLENVRQEATQQVTRLRDHPSIVLWCGNNEVQTGWQAWDDRRAFKQTIDTATRARIERAMHELFDVELRDVATTHAPETPYWPSSPDSDDGEPANALGDGDTHVWDVWGGSQPVGQYLAETPRFQSEYGLQSFPAPATIASFAAPDEMSVDSPVIRAHQKFDHGNGNVRLLSYVRNEFGEPRDFASLVYLSQIMQAEGIALAAEHLRASRPQSMGSMYWQLDDAWPGITWSGIDWFGRWKALQFHARKFYAPLLAAALRRDGRTSLSVVSDLTATLHARWRLRVMDFSGKLLQSMQSDVTLPPLASTRVGDFADAQLLRGADPRASFAVFELLQGDRVVSRNLVLFAAPKALPLPSPHIRAQLVPAKDGYTLTLESDKLAREVWVSFDDPDAVLSDNAFDLLPGEKLAVSVQSRDSLDDLRGSLKLQDLADAMSGSAP